jgi:hypothetical protein
LRGVIVALLWIAVASLFTWVIVLSLRLAAGVGDLPPPPPPPHGAVDPGAADTAPRFDPQGDPRSWVQDFGVGEPFDGTPGGLTLPAGALRLLSRQIVEPVMVEQMAVVSMSDHKLVEAVPLLDRAATEAGFVALTEESVNARRHTRHYRRGEQQWLSIHARQALDEPPTVRAVLRYQATTGADETPQSFAP